MGLDMYLVKKTYVKKWDHTPADKQFNVTVTRGGEPYTAIDPNKVTHVEEELMHWRKANQIHSWFVKNVQDGEDNCVQYSVDKQDLEALLEDCYRVRDTPEDAPVVLPILSGFFYGSDQYDEYYFDQINNTIEALETIVDEMNDDSELYYQSSW